MHTFTNTTKTKNSTFFDYNLKHIEIKRPLEFSPHYISELSELSFIHQICLIDDGQISKSYLPAIKQNQHSGPFTTTCKMLPIFSKCLRVCRRQRPMTPPGVAYGLFIIKNKSPQRALAVVFKLSYASMCDYSCTIHQ